MWPWLCRLAHGGRYLERWRGVFWRCGRCGATFVGTPGEVGLVMIPRRLMGRDPRSITGRDSLGVIERAAAEQAFDPRRFVVDGYRLRRHRSEQHRRRCTLAVQGGDASGRRVAGGEIFKTVVAGRVVRPADAEKAWTECSRGAKLLAVVERMTAAGGERR